jgi:hypothetical protein
MDILALIQAHPYIAIGIAAYRLFSGQGSLGTFLVPILKFLLSRLEVNPTPGPGPAPAPFSMEEFLKKLIDQLFVAKAAGDKDHEEAVLKVLAKCPHCEE